MIRLKLHFCGQKIDIKGTVSHMITSAFRRLMQNYGNFKGSHGYRVSWELADLKSETLLQEKQLKRIKGRERTHSMDSFDPI